MSEAKHTPGPWTIGDENNSHVEVCIGDAVANLCREERYSIGMVFSRDEMRANARLIAAAPELLDALTAFVHDPDDPDSCFCGGRFNVFGDQSKPSHSDACNKARALDNERKASLEAWKRLQELQSSQKQGWRIEEISNQNGSWAGAMTRRNAGSPRRRIH